MHKAHELDLNAVDLNLLVVLDALLRTQSVTAAARQLGRTQSAVSHALARLRDQLDDPVLVRTGRGMSPTPRAEALAAPLRAVLVDVQRVLTEPAAFVPAHSERVFRIACPDLFEALVLPRLLSELTDSAPGVGVVAMPVRGSDAFAQVLSGELDAIALPVPQGSASPAPNALHTRTLLRDRLVVFVRRDHPALVDGTLTLSTYCALPHVMVTQVGRGPGPVDHALAAVGHTRTVRARIRSFLTAPHLLATTDLVLTGPASLASLLPKGIVGLPAPLDLPGHRLDLLWHPRLHADAGHAWFRDQLVASLGGAAVATDDG